MKNAMQDTLAIRTLTLIALLALVAAPICAEDTKPIAHLEEVRELADKLRVSICREPEALRKADRALHVIALPVTRGHVRFKL